MSLSWCMHHIVSDGWSVGVLIREFGALYAAFVAGAAVAAAGAADAVCGLCAVAAASGCRARCWSDSWRYWKEQLSERLRRWSLPTDRRRPAVQSFGASAASRLRCRRAERGAARPGAREGATLFMVLLAAFQVLLSRWMRASTTSWWGRRLRGRTRRETRRADRVLRQHAGAAHATCRRSPSFRELLGRVREVALGAYAHQDLPFEKLVEELQPVRDLSRRRCSR